jgi:hypothetical protein
MSPHAYFVEESAVPVESGGDGALALHRHPTPELYYFLEGSGLMRLDDAEVGLGAGNSLPLAGQYALVCRFPIRLISRPFSTIKRQCHCH